MSESLYVSSRSSIITVCALLPKIRSRARARIGSSWKHMSFKESEPDFEQIFQKIESRAKAGLSVLVAVLPIPMHFLFSSLSFYFQPILSFIHFALFSVFAFIYFSTSCQFFLILAHFISPSLLFLFLLILHLFLRFSCGRPVFLFKLVFKIRFSDALLATEVILIDRGYQFKGNSWIILMVYKI